MCKLQLIARNFMFCKNRFRPQTCRTALHQACKLGMKKVGLFTVRKTMPQDCKVKHNFESLKPQSVFTFNRIQKHHKWILWSCRVAHGLVDFLLEDRDFLFLLYGCLSIFKIMPTFCSTQKFFKSQRILLENKVEWLFLFTLIAVL